MEGLPYDFGAEDKTVDKEKTVEVKTEKAAKVESKEKIEEPKVEKDKPSLSEQLLRQTIEKSAEELKQEPVDLTPELEAEASVEHLNDPEITAISQTIATDRLEEMHADEPAVPTSEDLAAESFLENVQASGDIDQAFSETLSELGEAAVTAPPPIEVEAETAMPVDPSTLIEAARSEISADTGYDLPREEEDKKPEETWVLRRPPLPPIERPKKKEKKETKPVVDSIVDYVIGRRYGRLNPEASHEDVERRLSQEVKELELRMAARETHVRQIAQSKAYEKNPQAVFTNNQTKQETISRQSIKPERHDERKPEKQTVAKREVAGISAHTMKRKELFLLAEKVKVEDSNLREIFERHLVGEKGLRRVVAEYLRGGDFKKALRLELLEKEKDFERDPKLRDQASVLPVATKTDQLDDLLQKSGIDWSEPSPTMLPPKPKSSKRPDFINELKARSNPIKKIADVALIAVILVLIAAIIYLIMKR